VLREGFGDRDPATAAGDQDPQLAVGLAELGQQGVDLGLQGLAIDRQLDCGRRAFEAVEMVFEGERSPAIEPNHLEDAVTSIDAVVAERDRGLGGGGDPPVDAGQLLSGAHSRARLSDAAGPEEQAAPCGN
jgi:hypothetical protein